jgi:hypothetical protein
VDEENPNVCVGNRVIKPCRLTDEIVDGARCFHASKATASNDERQQLTTSESVRLQRRRFQQCDHRVVEQGGVAQVLHGCRPVADPGHLEEVRLRAEREEQMVELELTPDIANSCHARNLSGAQVDCVHLGLDDLDVTENAPEWIDNIARM